MEFIIRLYTVLLCTFLHLYAAGDIEKLDCEYSEKFPVDKIRDCCEKLADNNSAVLSFLSDVEAKHGNLNLDRDLPSLYTYKSVALFEQHSIHAAGIALCEAVKHNPTDVRAWINLAEIRGMITTVGSKYEAQRMIEKLTGKVSVVKQYQRIMWNNLESNLKQSEIQYHTCLLNMSKEHCENANIAVALEYVELNNSAKMQLQQYFTRGFHREVTGLANLLQIHRDAPRTHPDYHLVVGFLLAVIDGGPVNALTQSLIRLMDRRRCTLVAFIISTGMTVEFDWMGTMLRSFDQIIVLEGLTNLEGATVVARHKVDVLIDMNGFQYISGVHIMKYRPCPIQINFLGDPLTAALNFMDYYVGDHYANPPDITAGQFTERLALLGTSYLANSHLHATPDLLFLPRQAKHALPLQSQTGTRHPLVNSLSGTTGNRRADAAILLGAFHSYVKFDPTLFQVWMNIMRRAGTSSIVFNANPSDPEAMQNLVSQAAVHGVPEQRVAFLALTTWYAHLHQKTALDLYLDTVRKNGHTTTVDAAWAGLPTVVLGSQRTPARRSAESILHSAAENQQGVVYSLKEYEDLTVELVGTLRGRQRLSSWRQRIERARLFGDLFDPIHYSDAFLHTMQSLIDLKSISGEGGELYNVF